MLESGHTKGREKMTVWWWKYVWILFNGAIWYYYCYNCRTSQSGRYLCWKAGR